MKHFMNTTTRNHTETKLRKLLEVENSLQFHFTVQNLLRAIRNNDQHAYEIELLKLRLTKKGL